MTVLQASLGEYLGLFIGTVFVAAWFLIKRHLYAQRLELLTEKYGDPVVAKRIIDKVVWTGESEEQVLDSMGRPSAIDQKLLKTKSKAVWKYGHAGANRYRLRITFEDGFVVGWDIKN